MIHPILLALFVAVIFALVLSYPLSRRGPGPLEGLLFFFLVLFLAIWAGGLWVGPIGPPVWGLSWGGFLAIGLLLALILAAATPPRRRALRPGETEAPTEEIALGLTIFFYLALLGLIAVIVLHYVAGL